MVLIPALQALEILAVAVVLVRKATRRTPLGRVVRRDLHGFNTVFHRLVLDVLEQSSERPDVLPRRLRDVLADMREVLEDDMRTAVSDGFFDEFVRYAVEVYLEAPVLLPTDALDSFVCGSRPSLLKRSTTLLVLPTPVVELLCRPERAG